MLLYQEQQALLLIRQQQQQQQEEQLAAAIRSLDVVNPIPLHHKTASRSSNSKSNHPILEDDHNQMYNSSMAQLPHEEVTSSFSTKRPSIRIEDLEQVRASVTNALRNSIHSKSGGGGNDDNDEQQDDDDDDDDNSNGDRKHSGDINATHQSANMAPSMNSINNFSMSLHQIQRPGRSGSPIDELMGSFSNMKTPSMEVNLDHSVYLSSLTATDPNASSSQLNHHHKSKNSSNNASGTLSQEQQRSKMMASTDTMGTIEQLGSTTDMSILMGSSTFSLFRHGNESSAVMEESGTTGTTTSTSGATAGSLMQRGGSNNNNNNNNSQAPSRNHLQRQNSNNHSQFMSSMIMTQPSHASKSSSKTSSSFESNNSFHFSEIFAKSNSNLMNQNNNSSSMAYVISDVRRQIDEEDTNEINIHDSSNYIFDASGVVATLPRTIGVMIEQPDENYSTSNQNSTDNLDMMIGSSTLAVLQNALLHSTNTEIHEENEDVDDHGHDGDDHRRRHSTKRQNDHDDDDDDLNGDR